MPFKDAENRRQHDRSLYKQRRSNGVCFKCGKPAELGKTRCQPCQDRDIHQKTKHRKALKRRAVEHLGGQCVDCGMRTDILAVYDFHHTYSDEKDTAIGRMIDETKDWERLRRELDKCVLLCANCHRIRHALEDDNIRLPLIS